MILLILKCMTTLLILESIDTFDRYLKKIDILGTSKVFLPFILEKYQYF